MYKNVYRILCIPVITRFDNFYIYNGADMFKVHTVNMFF